MLRAFAYSTRRPTLNIVQCSRRQSTTADVSSPANEKRKSSSTENLKHAPPQGGQEPEILAELADALEAKPEHIHPRVASTSAEMFGKRERFDHRAIGLKYDPTQLPIKRDLDPWKAAFTEEEYAMTLVHGRSVHEPFLHPRTYDIPVANIHFRSHHIELLNLFTHFALHAASSLGIPTSGVASLPTKRTLWTVPRSPFVHKKSQENFERKVHKRAIKAWDADTEVVQRWIAYLRVHALAGVGMKVTTWDRIPLAIGNAKIIYGDEDHSNPLLGAPKAIKQLGEKIVLEEKVTAERA